MTRKYTRQLLDMIEDGLLDRDTVIMACVKYMSEDQVQDMMEANEFVPEQFEDEDEEDEDEEEVGSGSDNVYFDEVEDSVWDNDYFDNNDIPF